MKQALKTLKTRLWSMTIGLLFLGLASAPATGQCRVCYCSYLGEGEGLGWHRVWDGNQGVSECILFELNQQWVCRWGAQCRNWGGGGGACVLPNGRDCDDWICNLYAV